MNDMKQFETMDAPAQAGAPHAVGAHDTHDAESIDAFYVHCRDYWLALGRSGAGESTGMLNFGCWSGSAANLFDAQRQFALEISKLLPQGQAPLRGLEIGCGIGGISIDMLKKMPHLAMTGLDISDHQLEVARANAQAASVLDRFTLRLGDAMALPFEDHSFDLTLCIESSFHYEDKASFFRENFRVLKPGGCAILADISCEDASQVKYRRGNHFEPQSRYVALARAAGFTVELVKDIGPDVYQPLLQHVLAFNRQSRLTSGKYWSVVLRNYAALADKGTMGYPIYRLAKPL